MSKGMVEIIRNFRQNSVHAIHEKVKQHENCTVGSIMFCR